MTYSIKAMATLVLMASLTTACAEEPEPVDAPTAEVEQMPTAQQAGLLPPEVLERLKEMYPVLREAPAPEPTPDGDGPGEVPDRFEGNLPDKVLASARGEATFYADKFEGRRTASGIPFRQNQMVAAHRGYPFGTLLRVTNLRNDRAVNVRVVDRGPFGSTARARNTVLDLSRRAATELGYIGAGRTPVQVEVLEWGEGLPRTG